MTCIRTEDDKVIAPDVTLRARGHLRSAAGVGSVIANECYVKFAICTSDK